MVYTPTKFSATEKRTRQHFFSENPQHVLVMQPNEISDIILLSPALRALREALPEAQITLLASATGIQAAPLLPWIDDVMVDRTLNEKSQGGISFNPREAVVFIEQLRRQRLSMAVIFTSVSQSPLAAAYACYLAGIPYRVGYAREPNHSALSHFLSPPADETHQVDRNLNLLEAIGISGASNRMELNITEAVESRTGRLLSESGVKEGNPYMVLAPGGRGVAGQYAPNHFASVAHILAAQTELQLVILGSSEETKSTHPILRVADENLYGNVHSLVGKTTVPEAAAIVRRASLVVTNNSAVMHFADVFGCPMVVLYSGTDFVSQWRPRNSPVRLLRRPAFCSSCYKTDCMNGINCLEVRPEEVAIAALELLAAPAERLTASQGQGLLEYKTGSLAQRQFPPRLIPISEGQK